jgi:hypothetical protein
MSLTREQADAIIAVIQADANTTGMLLRPGRTVYGEAKQCVIGGLLTAAVKLGAAGVDALVRQTAPNDVQREALWEWFGLDGPHQSALMATNDVHTRTIARRRALIRVVESWVSNLPVSKEFDWASIGLDGSSVDAIAEAHQEETAKFDMLWM